MVEWWFNGYVMLMFRLIYDIIVFEDMINMYLLCIILFVVDGVIDNDYIFLVLKRVGDGLWEYWM